MRSSCVNRSNRYKSASRGEFCDLGLKRNTSSCFEYEQETWIRDVLVFWFLMSGPIYLEIGLSSEKLDLESPSAQSLCGCLRNTVTSLVRVTVLSQPSGCGPKAQGSISGTTLFHLAFIELENKSMKKLISPCWSCTGTECLLEFLCIRPSVWKSVWMVMC